MKRATNEERALLAEQMLRSLENASRSKRQLADMHKVPEHVVWNIIVVLRKADAVSSTTKGYGLLKLLDSTELNTLFGVKKDKHQETIKCKECEEELTRIRCIEGDQVVFRNEHGSQWHGLLCPDCFDPTGHYFGEEVPEAMTTRKCRGCPSFLPVSRYFKCYSCQPDLPTEDDTFSYHCDLGDDNLSEMEEIVEVHKEARKIVGYSCSNGKEYKTQRDAAKDLETSLTQIGLAVSVDGRKVKGFTITPVYL